MRPLSVGHCGSEQVRIRPSRFALQDEVLGFLAISEAPGIRKTNE